MNDIEAAEREAFAKYITSQEHIGFDAVVWRGIGGDPLGVLHEPEYSENSLRSEWAAWLARSALAHAARGEGGPPPWHAPCVLCGHRQSAHNTDTGPCSKCGCDCAAFRPTPPPATGEAGTRGEVEIRADERERCAKWHDERAETSGNERAAWWHKDCAAALRALPEAREGGGK